MRAAAMAAGGATRIMPLWARRTPRSVRVMPHQASLRAAPHGITQPANFKLQTQKFNFIHNIGAPPPLPGLTPLSTL